MGCECSCELAVPSVICDHLYSRCTWCPVFFLVSHEANSVPCCSRERSGREPQVERVPWKRDRVEVE